MASLIKQKNWYYAQFYDKSRQPVRKRIALKTQTKRTAEILIRRLEDNYATNDYDPWTGYDASNSSLPISKNSNLKEVLEFYVAQKSKEDWRSKTSKNTSYVLYAFGRLVGLEANIRSLNSGKVNSFLNNDNLAYATKRSHKTKVLPFAKWCHTNKLVRDDFSEVKIFNNDGEQTETINYLTEQEIDKLKKGIQEKVEKDILKGHQSKNRNALWLTDFIDWQRYSGMRISETLSLRPSSINTDTWEVTIGSDSFSTKSKAKQILPIAEVKPLKLLAKKLLSNSKEGERLFKHKDRRRTSRTFKKYIRHVLPNREEINVHSLRHTCCIHLLKKGVPIYTVQKWMRHASVKTTQNYADMLNIDLSCQIGNAFN